MALLPSCLWEDYYFSEGFPTNIILDKNSYVIYFSSGGRIDKNAADVKYNELSTEIDKALIKK